ncbi:MAG: hypothetical protein GY811_15090 [Myxococcales bacterium]|nr:hypothetical protein [Myxococcales bacterium]
MSTNLAARSFGFILAMSSISCAGSAAGPEANAPAPDNSSHERLYSAVPVEKVDIGIGAERSGHSLVVQVHGVGRGHESGGAIENPKAWHVTATHGAAPLRLVLAGPAKVSRAPTGAAMGDQWNIEVHFMVAFALPDRAGAVEVRVQAPTGESNSHQLEVPAPTEKLSMRLQSHRATPIPN